MEQKLKKVKIPKFLRNVCFTINNPTREDADRIAESERVSYWIMGLEVGESGTEHIQGYLELAKRMRFKSVVQWLLPRGHLEPRRGSQKQAIEYCKKAGKWKEGGKPKRQGRRTDIEYLKERCKTERYSQIAQDCPNYNLMRMCKELCSLQPIDHNYEQKEVTWLYGSTGSGKTRHAFENCPPEDTWHATTGQWFDGYDGQTHVIIDEFRAKTWPYDLMLRITDGYKMRLPIKGGFTVWKPKVIYITCPLSPAAVYHGQLEYHGSIEQLERRITNIVNMDELPPILVHNKISS